MWTIKYNGVEKSLADWGLTDLVRSRQNLGVDTVQFLADGREVDADELFAYGSTVIIQRDRAGSGNAWSGGKRWFYGRIAPWTREGDDRSERQSGSCVGPMWYLNERTFRQSMQVFNGYTDPADPNSDPTFITKSSNHIFLNQALDLVAHPDGKLNWREQVIEALQWCITCGDPIAIGNITPAFDVPIDELKNIKAIEVLQQMFRWCPDAIFWWDYTAEPYPTLNVSRQADLAPVAIDLNDGDLITRIQLRERPDWKRPYVLIQYEQETNGILSVVEDVYPDPIPAGPPPGGLETVIDLKGWSFNKLSQRLSCAAYNANDIAWWKSKLAWLNDSKTIAGVELVTTTADAPAIRNRDTQELANLLLHYNELLPASGSIADWMIFTTERVRAEALVNVTFKNGSVKKNERITFDFVITNAANGTYSTDQITQVGDPRPVDLAQQMWTALQALGCEGEITLTDEDVPEVIDFNNALSFTTAARPAWANLNAIVQQIDDVASTGSCTIGFGAPRKLDAGELIDLLQVARKRFNPSSLNLRQGTSGSSGTTTLPDKGGESNGGSGAGHYNTHVTSTEPDVNSQSWHVKNSADGGTNGLPVISVEKVNDAGVQLPDTPGLKLDMGVLPADKQVKLQACQLSVGGVMKTVYVAASDAFSGGGSGSGAIEVTLVAVWHDVYECLNGNNTIYVAKSRKLRNSIASETLRGTVYNYIYDASYDTRTSNSQFTAETQVVIPPFIIGDKLLVSAIPETDLVRIPGDNPVLVTCGYIDLNADGRAWSRDAAV